MAAQMGVRAVEVDVVLSKDGIPVLFHDATLDRTSTGSGPVGGRTLAELETLDAGAWFGKGFAAAKIPTLAAAIPYALGHDLTMNIEIKPQSGKDEETARAAAETVSKYWPRDASPPLFSSFSIAALAAARAVAPDIPRAVLFAHASPADWLAQAAPVAPAALHVNRESLNADTVAAVGQAGYACGAYTVNSFWEAKRLFDAGVDYIFTDAPDEVAGVI